MSTYVFEKPLIRGMMLKRKSQFTALVDIAGEELIAHIPTTNRIGDVENKKLPCLLSYHDDPKRKLKYDIEAVLLSDDENWVGFVYTFPEYRGNRCMGKLLEYVYILAKNDGHKHIYISTGETGLYEKYGYQFWKIMEDVHGDDSRVYRTDIDFKYHFKEGAV